MSGIWRWPRRLQRRIHRIPRAGTRRRVRDRRRSCWPPRPSTDGSRSGSTIVATMPPAGANLDLTGHQGRVRRVAFSPSADRLASAGHDGTAWVWDLKTGGGCRLPVADDGAPCSPDGGRTCPNVHQALFAPDGRWLLTTSSDLAEPVRFWDPGLHPAGGCARLGRGRSGVQAAAVSEGLEGATWSRPATTAAAVRVMRMDATGGDWAPVCAAQWHTDTVTDAAFSPDGRWLARPRARTAAPPWSHSDRRRVRVPPVSGAASRYPLQRRVRAGQPGAGDRGIGLAGAGLGLDGTLLAELVGHKDRIYAAKFSPDGRWILTASRDGAVRIWIASHASEPASAGVLSDPRRRSRRGCLRRLQPGRTYHRRGLLGERHLALASLDRRDRCPIAALRRFGAGTARASP
jgi:WD40 repeat protein